MTEDENFGTCDLCNNDFKSKKEIIKESYYMYPDSDELHNFQVCSKDCLESYKYEADDAITKSKVKGLQEFNDKDVFYNLLFNLS